ncbi:hypothetical protein NicSoilB4_21020 [Arthrobacter sp. NicSoilB4]|uniref:hypothetical protein n=1 Tax=Arthrobacter sp. NicSoilB4 TaxID=2830997 RepID=UPI001CC64343|nr:hypothetical protein [Arthrobacter sp. NicSoilB4]BCW67339.1 hypothetical protein NicSoilB4_21020 [Arthrobacter sp. NicSoilB4]
MAMLKTLWIIHTTAIETPAVTRPGFPTIPGTGANAGTDDKFDLLLNNRRFRFPDLPDPDEREPGKTEEYEFDVQSARVDMDNVSGRYIVIEILGNDAWLPSSIWAIGEDVNGDSKVLAHVPKWPVDRYWSRDSREGQPRRRLV